MAATINLMSREDGYSSCDVGISKEQWFELLQDSVIVGKAMDALLKFFRSPEHKSTCKGVTEEGSPQSANAMITAFAKRVGKKLNINVIGSDGKQTFWPIPMKEGRLLSDGHYEWTLRDELAEAIKDWLILDLLKRYKEAYLSVSLDNKGADELYKWQLITDCVGKSELDIIQKFKTKNIVDVPRVNQVLTYLSKEKPQQLADNFASLKNEDVPLSVRLSDFKNGMADLCGDKFNVKANDERTAAAFLTCWNPEKYTFYKDELYQNYSNYIGDQTKKTGLKYSHYLKLLEPFVQTIQQDVELMDKFLTETNGLVQSDLLTAQNILWQMKDMMKMETSKSKNDSKSELNMIPEEIQKYTNILRLKKNIILQGAPGTGKTYNTAALALAICGEQIPEDHEEVMSRYEELQKDGRIGFVTFHQSMDYEDFVEGIKPKTENGMVSYEVEDGIFKLLSNKAQTKSGSSIVDCIDKFIHSIEGFSNKKLIPTITGRSSLYVWWNKGNSTLSTRSSVSSSSKESEHSPSPINIEKLKMQAVGEGMENNWPTYAQAIINAVKNEYRDELEDDHSTTPYVLIIDEINRGNVSKIFGELITLLEADKRIGGDHPIRVTLPYSKESFGVPSNLYIIGTMNTTDRSVGNIDYAVRRRFAFATLKADKELVKQNSIPLAVELFGAVESFIKRHQIDMDFEDLMVGHSYFFAKDENELELKWQYEILPLLNEYIKDGIVNAKTIDNEMPIDMFVEMSLTNSFILQEEPTSADFEVQTEEAETLNTLFSPSDEIHGVTYYMQFTEILQVLKDYTHNSHLKFYNLQMAMKKYGFITKSVKQRRFEMQPRNLYPVKITQNDKWLYDRCYEFMDYHQLKSKQQ
jgi:5-methylcytosine-specific restriction protein B